VPILTPLDRRGGRGGRHHLDALGPRGARQRLAGHGRRRVARRVQRGDAGFGTFGRHAGEQPAQV